MITNFDLFELTQFKEGNLNVIYRDSNVSVVVPLSPNASDVTCRGTEWCSRGDGFNNWSKQNILFRFLFKDGYKLRLTWRHKLIYELFIYDPYFSWGSGGKGIDYVEISSHSNSDPFTEVNNLEKEVKKENRKKIKEKDKEIYLSCYKSVFDTKMEIIRRIKMIPPEAINKVIEYKNNIKGD